MWFPRIKYNSGKETLKAQASLEMAIALISVFILIFGIMNVFIWLNSRLVRQQQAYEGSRVSAGSSNSAAEIQVGDAGSQLNILKGAR